ncbi:MAG: Asp-tRNA(Asn)/Glu-tRNA(Gln) amidotransferase subunit GatC [Janthinobacterium lividum]
MSAISRSEVEHLARLARIDMSDEELDRMAGQLGAVLDAVAQVSSVVSGPGGEDIPATSHPVPLINVTRPDVVRPGLSAQEALAGAPASEGGRFRVPQILEEDA